MRNERLKTMRREVHKDSEMENYLQHALQNVDIPISWGS